MSTMMDRTNTLQQMSFDFVNEIKSPSNDSTAKKGKKKGNNWKKPDDMPKRPLSAYNLFFADERKRLIQKGYLNTASRTSSKTKAEQQVEVGDSKTSINGTAGKKGKMNFASLARNIAAKWKSLDSEDKKQYEKIAQAERDIYNKKMKEYRITQKALKQQRDDEKEDNKAFSLLGALQIMQQDQYNMPILHASNNASIPSRRTMPNMPNDISRGGCSKEDLTTLLKNSLSDTIDELSEEKGEFGFFEAPLPNFHLSLDVSSREKQNVSTGFAFPLSMQKLALELDEDESNFLVETFRL